MAHTSNDEATEEEEKKQGRRREKKKTMGDVIVSFFVCLFVSIEEQCK